MEHDKVVNESKCGEKSEPPERKPSQESDLPLFLDDGTHGRKGDGEDEANKSLE